MTIRTKRTRLEFWKSLSHIMDFSNFDKSHELYDPRRQNVPGFFKDESGGKVIFHQAISLNPKKYSLKTIDSKTRQNLHDLKRAKGVPKVAMKNLRHEDYLRCLKFSQTKSVKFKAIRSSKFVLSTQKLERLALSNIETKRYWTCEKHSLAFGSVLIEKFKKTKICEFCVEEENLKITHDDYDDIIFEEDDDGDEMEMSVDGEFSDEN